MAHSGQQPVLGVIIPSYNRSGPVLRALASVLRQKSIAEVIVVDDASPDPVDLGDAARDPRVQLIRHDTNLGVCGARNTGVAAARASHLLFVDDDDRLLPWAGWCLRRWAARATDKIVVGGVLVEYPGRRPRLRRPPSSGVGDIWGLDGHLIAGGLSVHTKQAAAIPRALLERVGGWDTGLRSRATSELFYRLTAVAEVAGHATPIYRLNRGFHDKLTADPAKRAASYDYIAQKHADLLRDPARQAMFDENHSDMMQRTAQP